MTRYITVRTLTTLRVHRCGKAGAFPIYVGEGNLKNSTKDQTAANVIYNSVVLKSKKLREKYPDAFSYWQGHTFELWHMND